MRTASLHRALPFALVLTLVACDEETRDPDTGPGGVDAGTPVDAGGDGVDAGGTGTDAGPPRDAGGSVDAGESEDAATTSDAGCTPATACATGVCGVVDDGCGGDLDCGGCEDGDPCDDDADCASELCFTETATGFPDGMCTSRCRSDSDCDVSDHCARIDPITLVGYCREDCVDDGDCRAGYDCEDADLAPDFVPDDEDECTVTANGTGAVGDACGTNADCAGGLDGFCVLPSFGFADGYCSLDCDTSSDTCPSGSHCSAFAGGGTEGFCVAECEADAECRGGSAGYLCYDGDADGASEDECWPAGTGASPIGGACDGVWDCAGGRDARCLTDSFIDGYCVEVGCEGDTECGSGAHCGALDLEDSSINVCTADCETGMTTCPDGQLCQNFNDDDQDECWTAGTGTGEVGAPCDAVYECAGGTRAFCVEPTAGGSWADGYCALSGCTAGGTGSESCPTGSRCSIATGESRGSCVKSCGDGGDCRSDGYDCYDNDDEGTETECLPAATGSGVVGDVCLTRLDCAGGRDGVCLLGEAFRGGYCTTLCADTACATGASCETVAATQICLDDCASAADCREPHYRCFATPETGDPDVCIPAT